MYEVLVLKALTKAIEKIGEREHPPLNLSDIHLLSKTNIVERLDEKINEMVNCNTTPLSW